MDRIIMHNMKFFGYHGMLPQEQKQGQVFLIDVEMSLDLKKVGNTDEISDTVDYSAVYELVRKLAENGRFYLIEKLADSIAREILSGYAKILEVLVRVKKPQAPVPGEFDWMGVEIRRSRDDV